MHNIIVSCTPSNFSEKVRTWEGISGVVLRLENPDSNHEREDATLFSLPGNTSHTKPSMPSESIHSLSNFPGGSNMNLPRNVPRPATTLSSSAHFAGTESDNFEESRHEYPPHGNTRLVPNWSSSHLQNSISDSRTLPSQVSASSIDSMVQRHPSVTSRTAQETTAAPQPEQLVQLASSLLGQQKQSWSTPSASTAGDLRASQNHAFLQHNQMSSEFSAPQSGQVQQLQQVSQQTSNVPTIPHHIGAQGSQYPPGTSTHEADLDPQTHLQTTLQLAAALLQQIQQGK